MDIGIGLPATIPGISGSLIKEWAVRAENGPFSTLGIVDRIVYPNHEPMVSLAAAAAVTERISLMTTVLLAPLRNHVVLAKQDATLQSISNCRFVVYIGLYPAQALMKLRIIIEIIIQDIFFIFLL